MKKAIFTHLFIIGLLLGFSAPSYASSNQGHVDFLKGLYYGFARDVSFEEIRGWRSGACWRKAGEYKYTVALLYAESAGRGDFVEHKFWMMFNDHDVFYFDELNAERREKVRATIDEALPDISLAYYSEDGVLTAKYLGHTLNMSVRSNSDMFIVKISPLREDTDEDYYCTFGHDSRVD